jgi:mannose-1-phosphate guanylyltransferase
MNNNYVVIMAGGIGSRFWPMSTAEHPKQFHDVLGTGRTLIQLTVDRYLPICNPENIIIVTNENYKGLVQEQLPMLKDEQILLEPSRKNTAPCIAYACYKIYAKNKDAKIIVAPSDHLILRQKDFEITISKALEKAESDCLITIGIKPSRPDTGYGYIQFEEDDTDTNGIRKVKTFTEKPSLEIAKRFIESGDFYWNSGMFVWSAKAIITAFEKNLPDLAKSFQDGMSTYFTNQESEYINQIYPMCKNISIDYGIMEKADNVFVILADLGWSDLGTWGSLYTKVEQDSNRNAIIGKKVATYDCNDNIVMMPDNKRVVLQGLNDFIVVESNETLLICKKKDEQKIKQFVIDLKSKK